MVCNEVLDHKDRGEGSQINASLSPSHSKISSHKEGLCWLDSGGKKNNISVEACKEGEALNSEIWNGTVDILFEIRLEISFQSFVGDQFDSMLEELHFGQFSFGRKRTENFYDPVAEYMD